MIIMRTQFRKLNPSPIIASTILVFLAVPWRTSLYKKPFIEDSWYSLNIARNISEGLGITIDGTQITNGFQPLQVLLDSLIFKFTNSNNSAITVIFVIRLLLHIISAIIFKDLVRTLTSNKKTRAFYEFAFISYMFNPAILHVAVNGLETGLALLLLLTLVRYATLQATGESGRYWIIKTILVATALIYARIDMLVIVVFVLVWIYIVCGSKTALQVGSSTALFVTPWFFWSYLKFGSVIPISGQQQQDPELSFFRVAHLFKATTFNISPWLGSFYDQSGFINESFFFVLRMICLTFIITIILRSQQRLRVKNFVQGKHGVSFAILAGLSVLSIYYCIATFATWFYPRYTIYFAPITLLIFLSLVGNVTRKEILFSLIAIFCSVCVFFTSYHSSRFENALYDNQVELAIKTVPQSEFLGARQSGTLGFHRAKSINLDGKVNPQAPRDIDAMNEYLLEQKIEWLCDWPSELDKIIGTRKSDWEVVSQNATVTCLKRKESN